jgi:hypothetical protein
VPCHGHSTPATKASLQAVRAVAHHTHACAGLSPASCTTAPVRTAPRMPYTRIAASKRGDSRSGCVCRLEVRGTVLRPYSGYIRCRKEACPSRWQVAAEHVPHRAACGATHMARQDAPSEAGMLLTSSSVIDPSKRIISTSCRINSEHKVRRMERECNCKWSYKQSLWQAKRRDDTVAAAERSGEHSQREASIASCERRGKECHLQRAPA